MNDPTPAVTYVGFWARTGAALIDMVLSAVILQPVLSALLGQKDAIDASLLSGSPEDLSTALLTGLTPHGPLDLLQSWLLPALAVIAFWVARQATPGKMVIGAEIVDAATLGKPTTWQWVVRYLGYYVSMFTLFVGFFWVAWDPRKQGFHDKLARTVVIRKPRASAPSTITK